MAGGQQGEDDLLVLSRQARACGAAGGARCPVVTFDTCHLPVRAAKVSIHGAWSFRKVSTAPRMQPSHTQQLRFAAARPQDSWLRPDLDPQEVTAVKCH